MKRQPFDAKQLFRSPEAVACLVDPSDLFTLLARSLQLPSDWAALLTHETGHQTVAPAGTEVTAAEITDILFFRTSPLILRYADLTAASADGYQCSAQVELPVSLIADRGELGSFRNAVLGSQRSADTSTLVQFFSLHLTTALAQCAEGRGVAVLIDAANVEEFSREVAENLKGTAFGAGLKIERPLHARFDSPVYRQVRRSKMEAARRREEFDARRRIEQAAEVAQQEHTEHLAELLAKLRKLADETPQQGLVDLVKTFPENQRGELYQALFATTGDLGRTQSIAVAAGLELLFFTPGSYSAPSRKVTLPDTVGALRSVQTGPAGEHRSALFIGAACGVIELDVDGDAPACVYRCRPEGAGEKVHGGFNSVALAGDRIYASHSELGLVCWRRSVEQAGQVDEATSLQSRYTRSAKAVRSVQFFNGDIYFSLDQRVCRLPADNPENDPVFFDGNSSIITAVCATPDGVFAGNADGRILYWPRDETHEPQIIHTGRQRPAETVVELDLDGAKRLFFTDTSTAVSARVLGDSFVCRYEAGGQTLRRVEVAPDLIVATNEVRDRLICWTPGEPAKPAGIVPVAQLTGRSVQDVCLVSAT